jgi:copper transport protein
MRLAGAAAVVALVGVLLGALAPGVLAHALLQSSDPAAGATVGSSPAAVTLTFGERADPRLSSIKVLDTSGQNHATGPVQAVEGEPLQLRVAVQPLADGVYAVSWRTLSAVDGHSAAGAFSFGVGVAVPATGPGSTAVTSMTGMGGVADASPAAAIARLLLYAGLIATFGAGIIAWLIVPSRARSVLRLAAAGWIASTVGTVAVVALQWAGAEADLGAILGTSLGISGLARFGSAVLGGLAVALAARSPSTRPFAGLAVTAGLAMAIDVLGGHAGAVAPAPLQLAFQWLHVAAAGFWVGGLAALLIALKGAPPEVRGAGARRFSLIAGFAIALVAVTGALRAIAEVGTFDALFGTDYGRLIIAKSALIVVLALLGATNHFWSVPAAGRTLLRLRRVGTTELSVAMVAVMLSAFLVDLAPPVSSGTSAAPPEQPIVVSGSDAGTSVRVRLVVTPGAAGTNDFAAAVTDYDTKQPVDAASVSLRFELVSASGVGPSTLDMTRTGTGAFDAPGGNLSIDGIWRITATVAAPAGAVEVPLITATDIPAQTIDVSPTAGLPTIYVVHLADGKTMQVYLDPETAGKDELHATFFDAAGNELPVETAAIAIVQAGATSLPIPRQLEPGHFVADVDVAAGDLDIDVAGPDPTATAPLHVHLSIPVQP